MINRIRRAIDERDEGFTLIELLVVVIIIGILAAIAIPIFLNQRRSAVDAGTESDIRNIATNVETWATANQGTYPANADAFTVNGETVSLATPALTIALSAPALAGGVGAAYTYTRNADGNGFVICGWNTNGNANSGLAANGAAYMYSSAAGGMTGPGNCATFANLIYP